MTGHNRARDSRVLVLDGGTGSELRRRGVSLSDQCWSAEANLSHTDLLTEIHSDYIRAGADIITANTFASTRFVLASAGLDSRFDDVNRSAIKAARAAADAADRDISVAASLSCLPPAFDDSAYPKPDAESRAYSELCACFIEQGIDVILLEMMQDTEHAALACRAASASNLPFWVGISCRVDVKDGLVGFDHPDLPFAAVLDTLLPFNPSGIAIMHSPLNAVGPALEELDRIWAGPVGAYAEISYPEHPSAQAGHIVTAGEYSAAAKQWLDQGAAMLGGCCGTTPEHIAALKALVND